MEVHENSINEGIQTLTVIIRKEDETLGEPYDIKFIIRYVYNVLSSRPLVKLRWVDSITISFDSSNHDIFDYQIIVKELI